MRTETKTVNVYEYGELSVKAKETAKSNLMRTGKRFRILYQNNYRKH